ncbi:MAG TPA: UDP-N-acetylmuramate dehydrogenase [Mycobacterium sp.]|nr:UDP-N-acetylmuramate dehydrogenase [Mycobacterium sp.]
MPDTFAGLTSIGVGGPAPHVIRASEPSRLIDATQQAWADAAGWLLLGGGSNVVVSDDGFDGTVVLVATRGIEQLPSPEAAGEGTRSVRLRVQAGEPWDGVVAYAVAHGLAGIEALSGIPGSSGAAPIQNIGAYGQELATRLVSVEFLDHDSGELARVPAADLEFGYRTSVFKQGRLGLVVSIDLELTGTADSLSDPVAYPQLAAALGVRLGDRVPIGRLREAVLALRAGKGMLISADDPDSVSAGSFFTNPIVSENFARSLPADAPRWPLGEERAPLFLPLDVVGSGLALDNPPVASAPRVKLSAAWLIEHAGIHRGFALPGSRAAISSKHTLAIVNTGGATAAEVSELARYIRQRVGNDFGIELQPEPLLVDIAL